MIEVAVIGAGPAGLSGALNLVRARRSTVLIDSNRPRNAATLASRGFLTRDGISPLELRRIGREEFERYPDAVFCSAVVEAIQKVDNGFRLTGSGVRGANRLDISARVLLIAVGLTEILPDVPGLRSWYGTCVHSCIECDGFEKSDAALALIGETEDLADRAILIAQWSSDLVVFTNGIAQLSASEEERLGQRGIKVERTPIAGIEGVPGQMTGVRLQDGRFLPRSGGFVRPVWRLILPALDALGVSRGEDGLIRVDQDGRTNVTGVYAAGDAVPPGPQQLIVAAGDGARIAAAINRDLIGALTT